MTQRRVENTRVHFWTFSPVSVNSRQMTTYYTSLQNLFLSEQVGDMVKSKRFSFFLTLNWLQKISS